MSETIITQVTGSGGAILPPASWLRSWITISNGGTETIAVYGQSGERFDLRARQTLTVRRSIELSRSFPFFTVKWVSAGINPLPNLTDERKF